MARILISFLFAIFFTEIYLDATKLNYPRVLLPIFDKISVNFTLEVIDSGCFKWTSSRHDLILVSPIYQDSEMECSYQAVVTVLSRERHRNTVIVLAENIATGESLHCDIILDVINKLGVTTTTRQLYLEEAPETFVLRAEDSQGNAFTTLEGVEFNWTIESLNSHIEDDGVPVLRFLTFTESSYHEVPTALEKFENQGRKGYKALLEGINTGTAKVTVSLPYPEYSDVPVIETYISVLANIMLEPTDIYMLIGDTISFRIYELRMGKLTEVTLNNQYYLEVEDNAIAKVSGASVTGKKLGRTSVILRDRNVPIDKNFIKETLLNTLSSVPSARLTVAEPKTLKLSLLPYKNWITSVGEKHVIVVDLYTRDDQKITLGSGYAIHTELDEFLFYVYTRNTNGSYLYGEALREGSTPLYASFKDLTAQTEINILRELSISPKEVLLPYDPANIIKAQQIQFTAYGGDGSYIWRTSQPRLLTINSYGLATTTIALKTNDSTEIMVIEDKYNNKNPRIAHIRVGLSKNPKIYRQATINFLPLMKMKILKYNFETALNDYVHIHVGIYGQVNGTMKPLTHCENLLLDYEFTLPTSQFQQQHSQQIFQINYNYSYDSNEDFQKMETMVKDSCQILHFQGKVVGLTHLTLSYKYLDDILKDEVTLYVFEPIKVVEPIQNEVTLPIGSSRNIIYSNGPERIYTLEAELTKRLFYDNQIVVIEELQPDSPKGFYAFNVLCTKLGSTVFSFGIFNALSSSVCEPYISNIETRIDCVKPRFLNLYANEPMRNTCPIEMKKTLLQLNELDNKFHIEIEVQDVKNRKLMNITSLLINWEFAAGSQSYSPAVTTHYIERDTRFYNGIVSFPVADILVIKLNEPIEKNFRVKGTVIDYDKKCLDKHEIQPEIPPFGLENSTMGTMYTPLITNEITFTTVNNNIFMSDHVNIFMDKSLEERIPLLQGSGYYDYDLTDEGIVKIDLQAQKGELIVTPLRTGQTRLALKDLCLMKKPAYLSISVVGIKLIRTKSLDRVEHTKSIEAIVQLYDTYDKPLNINVFNLHIYNLYEEISNPHILDARLGDQSQLNVGEIRYILTGNNLGETKIVFSAGKDDLLVSSEPLNVQVFAPLKMYPRKSILVVNSTLQIYHYGGPQPDANIIYTVHDKKVASIESGIVTALKLGKTKITGKCFITNPENNKNMLIVSKDTIDIEVVVLSNIQIKTPLTKIRSGGIMPATLWGVPDLSPLVLCTLNNTQVTWHTNHSDVISIYNTFAEAGIEYEGADLISVHVKALNPGKAKIVASIQLPNGEVLTDTLEIVVFKILALESPKHVTTDTVLIPPNSRVQLKVNLDDAMYYAANENSNILTVENDGLIHSREMLGRDFIIANTSDQSLVVGVEIKNIHYILATLRHPTLQLRQTEKKIPTGTNFMLKISLHDNLGNEFAHTIGDEVGIKYTLSQKNTVDVHIGGNLTIALNMPHRSNNMIVISLKDSVGVKHTEHYVKLSVDYSKQLHPVKTIFSVGDIICFESPITTTLLSPLSTSSLFSPSYWSSSDESILTIDKYTGIAQVLGNRNKLGEKVTIVHGDIVSGNFIKYDVEVHEADVVKFTKTSDIFNGFTYRGHFVMQHHSQSVHQKRANLIARNETQCINFLYQQKVPLNLFKCHLKSKVEFSQQLLENYITSPIFDIESGGLYACEILLKPHSNEVLPLSTLDNILFELKVTLNAYDISDTLSLKFVPGIKVMPEVLSLNNVQQDLVITGLDKVLQKVEVNSSDDNALKVKFMQKGHGSLRYNIQIIQDLSTYEHKLFAHVYSPSTLQHIKIPFTDNDKILNKCSAQPLDTVLNTVQTVLYSTGVAVIVIILLVCYVWFYCFRNGFIDAHHINNAVFAHKQKEAAMNESSFMLQASNTTPEHQHNNSIQMRRQNISLGNDYQSYGDVSFLSPERSTLYRRRYM